VTRRQQLTLAAAILGSAVASIDGSVVNVALPAIVRDLGGGLEAQQWISNAYLLTLGSLILVGGSLGDLYGERRVFATGVGLFGLCSIGCAFAPSVGVLIAMRALQGVAAALLTPASLAVIVGAFSAKERGAAVGSWTAWGGIASIGGPLVGGAIVDVASWRWVFLVNVPIVIVTLVLIFAAIPASRPARGRRLDLSGAALGALALAGIAFALIEAPQHGWSSPAIYLPLLAGIACGVAFVVHERHTAQPLLELELFERRNFTVGNLETLTMYAGLAIVFFFLTIFLQQVAGYTALQSGLATIPVTLVMFATSRRFGSLADRHGPRRLMGLGPLAAAAGILLLMRVGMHVVYATDLLPALLLFALGLSMTVAPLTATVLASADESDAGIASAINNAVARVAGLIGTSAVGAAIAGSLPGGTFAHDAASVAAFHDAILICAVLVAAGGITGLLGIVDPKEPVDARHCPGGQLAGAPLPAAVPATPRPAS
jgi:EmrB/QacA subfamily drug resistance transporter